MTLEELEDAALEATLHGTPQEIDEAEARLELAYLREKRATQKRDQRLMTLVSVTLAMLVVALFVVIVCAVVYR